jgi:hypothetical protein
MPQLIQFLYTLKFETWVSGCSRLVRHRGVGGYVNLLPIWSDIKPRDVNEDQTASRREQWMVRVGAG